MTEPTDLQWDILGIVSDLPRPTDASIRQELERRYGSDGYDGRVGPSLHSLEADGLITSSRVENGVEVYSLTTRGERELPEP